MLAEKRDCSSSSFVEFYFRARRARSCSAKRRLKSHSQRESSVWHRDIGGGLWESPRFLPRCSMAGASTSMYFQGSPDFLPRRLEEASCSRGGGCEGLPGPLRMMCPLWKINWPSTVSQEASVPGGLARECWDHSSLATWFLIKSTMISSLALRDQRASGSPKMSCPPMVDGGGTLARLLERGQVEGCDGVGSLSTTAGAFPFSPTFLLLLLLRTILALCSIHIDTAR